MFRVRKTTRQAVKQNIVDFASKRDERKLETQRQERGMHVRRRRGERKHHPATGLSTVLALLERKTTLAEGLERLEQAIDLSELETILPKLMPIFEICSTSWPIPMLNNTLRSMAKVATGDPKYSTALLSSPVLQVLRGGIGHPDLSVRVNTLLVWSQIAIQSKNGTALLTPLWPKLLNSSMEEPYLEKIFWLMDAYVPVCMRSADYQLLTPTVFRALKHSSTNIVAEALTVVHLLASRFWAKLVREPHFCSHLLGLLMRKDEKILLHALVAIRHLLNMGSEADRALLERKGDLLRLLYRLSWDDRVVVRAHSILIVANLAAGPIVTLKRIQDLAFFQRLVDLLNKDVHRVQVEVLWAICNIIETEYQEFLLAFSQLNLVPALLNQLNAPDSNVIELSMIALTTLQNNGFFTELEEYGGISKLENLFLSENPAISERAQQLVDAHHCMQEM